MKVIFLRKRLNYSLILITILALALLGIGCNKTPQQNDDNKPPIEDELVDTEITLYFSDDQAMYLVPETRIVQVEENITNEKLITTIVEELIKGPENQTLIPTIPPETKLLAVETDKELAKINFSTEIQTKHWGGSTGESMTVNSLVNTVTEVGNIEKVLILVEGEVQDTLIGHLYTKEPFERDERVIKK